MAYNQGRAAGCVIGYNTVIKAVRYIKNTNTLTQRHGST